MSYRGDRKSPNPCRPGPRIEVTRFDEAPDPVPAVEDASISGVERRQNGQVADTEAARALGRKGGLVKAKRVRLARSLGLSADTNSAAFAPYRRSATSFRRHHCAELAKMAGGELGSGPSSFVASSALQLAASRFIYDQAIATNDPSLFKTASQLADASRQNLMAAYEIAVREAAARPKASFDPIASYRLPPKESK